MIAAVAQHVVLNEQASDRPVVAYLLQKAGRRDNPFFATHAADTGCIVFLRLSEECSGLLTSFSQRDSGCVEPSRCVTSLGWEVGVEPHRGHCGWWVSPDYRRISTRHFLFPLTFRQHCPAHLLTRSDLTASSHWEPSVQTIDISNCSSLLCSALPCPDSLLVHGQSECRKWTEFGVGRHLSSRKKIEHIGRMTQMTQEEIITNTKTVMQGLEALKNEHNSILNGLTSSLELAAERAHNVVEEKQGLVQKSLDMIELGLGEAQVSPLHHLHFLVLPLSKSVPRYYH
ncbi:hypothetical protein PR048_028477 [Dryococelus australis]|uniref:Uncharacterized protein n=1 Tax=Dryococelus australis TaxID=614101 RepID=A0ABQ9GD82_9NEOP|nr:hypothetical protein PR048_028477 [Dryococelus australis]